MAATKKDAIALLENVIRPTLNALNLWSPAAEELLLGTAIVESDLTWRRQRPHGPARSLWQMEADTHNDIWNNFLKYQPAYRFSVGLLLSNKEDKIHELEFNDKYACAMARLHYRRVKEALPEAGDVAAISQYWKNHYNTIGGKGDNKEYIKKWNNLMGASK